VRALQATKTPFVTPEAFPDARFSSRWTPPCEPLSNRPAFRAFRTPQADSTARASRQDDEHRGTTKSRASNSGKASLTQASGPTPIERITKPFQEFSENEAIDGVLLLTAAALALAWANSPWAESYSTLWEHRFTIGFEGFALSKSILHWINPLRLARLTIDFAGIGAS
jgi:hypothetical protein